MGLMKTHSRFPFYLVCSAVIAMYVLCSLYPRYPSFLGKTSKESISLPGGTFPSGSAGHDMSQYIAPPAGKEASLNESSPLSNFLLAVSNHKTGTVLGQCIFVTMAEALGFREPKLLDTTANFTEMSQYLASPPTYWPSKTTEKDVPILMTDHNIRPTCFAGPEFIDECELPCSCRKENDTIFNDCLSTNLTGCSLALPAVDPDVLFFIRKPLDTVISAHLYHIQDPPPESWLTELTTFEIGYSLRAFEVPEEYIEELGWFEEDISLYDKLHSLPFEKSILASFWHALPDLYRAARQHLLFTKHGSNYQVAVFEDFKADYNKTIGHLLWDSHLVNTTDDLQRAVDVLQVCDIQSEKRLDTIDYAAHVSNASKETKEKLASILLSRNEVAEHLCELAQTVGYDVHAYLSCGTRK